MTITELEDILYSWLADYVGIKTIFAYQHASRPESLYATINVNGIEQVGEEERIEQTIGFLDDFTISINVYYSGALNYAKIIKESIEKIEVKDYFSSVGLGFKTFSNIRKIPAVIKSKWEERAQFDISFYIVSTTTESASGVIENIEVNDMLIEKE